jgi:broad specificity phosphatase PhoE
MKILFTRHGESLANTLHIISNRDLPHGLTENGRDQAQKLAENLAKISDEPHALPIYASPVLRAKQTAEIVASRLAELGKHAAVDVVISPGLSEYDCGILEGRGDPDAWAEHRRLFHDWLEGRNRDLCLQGGETFTQIRARLADFINELLQQSDVTILCVSHGGTLRLGLPGLLSNIDFNFVQTHSLDHTEIIVVENQGDKFICCSWGKHIFD